MRVAWWTVVVVKRLLEEEVEVKADAHWALLLWTSPLIGRTHLSRPRSSQARPSDWNLQSAGPSGISLASVCPNMWSSVQTSAPRWAHQALPPPYTTPRLAGFGGCLGMPKYVVINSDVCSPAEPTRHSLIHIQHQGCWILASSSMKGLSSPLKRRYICWLQSFTLLPFFGWLLISWYFALFISSNSLWNFLSISPCQNLATGLDPSSLPDSNLLSQPPYLPHRVDIPGRDVLDDILNLSLTPNF